MAALPQSRVRRHRPGLALTTALASVLGLSGTAGAAESPAPWPRGAVLSSRMQAICPGRAEVASRPVQVAQAAPAKTPTEAELVAEVASLLEACSYDGAPIRVDARALSINSQAAAQQVVREIMRFTGLPQNFEILEGPVPNAAALIVLDDNKVPRRVIAYNPRFMQMVREATRNNDWAPISIMAHEVGHHLSGHTLLRGGSQPPIELEADKFSGFVLHKMGASLIDARTAIEVLVPVQDGPTHPGRGRRVAAIEAGWREACEQRGGPCDGATIAQASKAPPVTVATRAEPSRAEPPRAGTPRVEFPAEAMQQAPASPPPPAAGSAPSAPASPQLAVLPKPDPAAIPSKFNRFIYDEIGLLDPESVAKFERQFYEHAEKSGVEIVTLVVRDLHGLPADQYAWAMLRQLRVGKLDVGNGAVLVYAPEAKQFGLAFGPGVMNELHNHVERYRSAAADFFEDGVRSCRRAGTTCNAAWTEVFMGSADHARRDTRYQDWAIAYRDFPSLHRELLKELAANFPKPSRVWGKIAQIRGTVEAVGAPAGDRRVNSVRVGQGEIPVLVKGEGEARFTIYTRAETMAIQPSGRLEPGRSYAFIVREAGLSHNLRDQQNFQLMSYVLAP